MPRATVAEFRDFHRGAKNATDFLLQTTLDVAAAEIERVAPPPTDPDPSYEALRTSAELFVARDIFDRRGNLVESEKIGSASRKFTTADSESLARSIMGGYAIAKVKPAVRVRSMPTKRA